jgi:ATP-binding cassette subfamily B protein
MIKLPKGLVRESRAVATYAKLVWKMVPRRHRLAFGFAATLMAVTAACNTALPVLLGMLVDRINVGKEQEVASAFFYQLAIFYLVLIGLAYLFREAINVARRYLVENSCTRLEKVLSVKLVAHLMKVDLAYLTVEKIGALEGRISRSVVGFLRFLRLAFLDLLPPILSGIFALVAALCKQPWLALAMAGVIPLSLLLTAWQIASQKHVRLQLIRSREVMDGTIVELLGGMDYVRAADTHEYEVERVARVAEKRRAREIRHHFQMSLFGCAKALNEGLFHILVISLAIYLAVQGRITFGDILIFSMLFLNVMAPLNEVHRALDEGHEASLQVADLLEMLAEPADRSFSPRSIKEPRLRHGEPILVTRDLGIDYHANHDRSVRGLRGVSVTIRHGETIGLVGPSGAGKTTWLRILMRLAHPTDGQVLLGGVPLEAISREAIGRLIGYVGQSPFVVAGTIAENIAYGTPKASDEAIRRAAEAAFIHDEILAMPGGYSAVVSERGQNLSGGQRQRLALARIFLKNPPVLILDEGTSALDSIGERKIQSAINAARDDHTIILAAHRLSTLAHADRIFVFEHGQVVESGSYTELLRTGGLFTKLARCSATVPREQLAAISAPDL